MENIALLRKEYSLRSFSEQEAHPNPFKQFEIWFEEAVRSQVNEPNAMHLSTVGADGRPRGRMVLLKGLEENRFIFFTNYNSHKGQELAHNPYAALTFFWAELERQIRIEGKVEKVDTQYADAYFRSRPRGAQIGAWVSAQSQIIPGRHYLEQQIQDWEKKFAEVEDIPRPPYWGGYALCPDYMEFWQGRPNRLHDRLCYRLIADSNWQISRLSP